MLSLDESNSFNAVLDHISDVGVAACAHVGVKYTLYSSSLLSEG